MLRLMGFVDLLDRRGGVVVRAMIVASLFLGFAYVWMRGEELPFVDEVDYYAIASNVVDRHFYSNDGIEPNGDRAPMFPLALAAVRAMGGHVAEMRMFNMVVYAATMWLLYHLVRKLRPQSTGLSVFAGTLAVMLVFAYPVLFYAAGTLFPQTLGGLLFVAVLYRLAQSREPNASVITGVLFGLLLLTIPMFIFSLAVIVVWMFAYSRGSRFRSTAALLLGTFGVVSIWTIRNYLAFHAFVLLTSASGATLLWGNSPEATIGGAEVEYLIQSYEAGSHLNQVEADRAKFRLAIEQMKGRWGEVAQFYFLKVLNHFSFVNGHYVQGETSLFRTLVMAATYCPLLLLLLVRLANYRKYPISEYELLLVAIYFSTAFAYAIFHTRIRYRLPYDYLLITVVALFVTEWIDRKCRAAVARGEISSDGGGTY